MAITKQIGIKKVLAATAPLEASAGAGKPKGTRHEMIKALPLLLLVFASGASLCAEPSKGNISIDDGSLKNLPEPIKCYSFLGEITGDEEMPVGLAVQLCAGTKNAKATLVCYKAAFEGLKLNRGLAIELCSEGRKLK